MTTHLFNDAPALLEDTPLSRITVRPGRRPIDQEAVENLVKDMGGPRGLMHRIVLNKGGDSEARVLVEGGHRLEAARQRKWVTIPAYVIDLPEIDAKLWEIAENLIRSELTVEEAALQRAEYARLTAVKRGEIAPDAGVSQLGSPPTPGRQSQAGGIRQAARETGVSQTQIRRDIAIASIPQEIRDEARAAGLDDNQSALLKVAAAAPEKQVEVLAGITKAKTEKKAKAKTTPPIELGASEYTVEPSKLPANQSLSPAEAIAVDVFRLLQDMPHADVIEFVRLVNDYDNIRMIRDPDGYVPALEAFIAKHGRQEALLESASAMAKEIIAAAKDAQPVEVATAPVEVELDRSAPWKGLAAAVAQAKTAGITAPAELARAA
jgi:hypothetical protein